MSFSIPTPHAFYFLFSHSQSLLKQCWQFQCLGGHTHWYHVMVHLNDTRCIPREANGGATATKADCIANFGPPIAQGQYAFLHRGSSEYAMYI